MGTAQVKMAFAYPEQTRPCKTGPGWERIPNHPTRPARATDFNTWWEDVSDETAVALVAVGAEVRIPFCALPRSM